MSLPLLRLEGTPFEQGVQHGEMLRDQIAHNMAVYFDRFAREVKLERPEVLARAERYGAAIAQQSPAYAEGMRGIAAGSGFSLPEVIALNVRYELFYDGFIEKPMADGCTAFALLPERTANGHLWIGENWDWIAGVQGAVVHTSEADGLQTLSFTEAGIFGGKLGLNSAGIGLMINGLTSQADDWARLKRPFHVRCYEILRSRDFAAATAVVTAEDRSCSTNFLIAQTPDQVINIEAAPGHTGATGCVGGCLVHANHFVDPAALGIAERSIEINPHSYWRHRRLDALLNRSPDPISLADLQAALRDHDHHPYSVCFHIDYNEPPEEYYETLTSVIIDLHARELYITAGPPCTAAYVKHTL